MIIRTLLFLFKSYRHLYSKFFTRFLIPVPKYLLSLKNYEQKSLQVQEFIWITGEDSQRQKSFLRVLLRQYVRTYLPNLFLLLSFLKEVEFSRKVDSCCSTTELALYTNLKVSLHWLVYRGPLYELQAARFSYAYSFASSVCVLIKCNNCRLHNGGQTYPCHVSPKGGDAL